MSVIIYMLPLPNGHQVPAKKLVPVQWPALNAFPRINFPPTTNTEALCENLVYRGARQTTSFNLHLPIIMQLRNHLNRTSDGFKVKWNTQTEKRKKGKWARGRQTAFDVTWLLRCQSPAVALVKRRGTNAARLAPSPFHKDPSVLRT